MIKLRLISRLMLAGLLLAGCTRLDSHSGPSGSHSGLDPESSRELVPVNLSLAVAPTEEGMLSSFAGTSSSFAGLTGESPATKTDYEPDAPGYDAAAAIKTITILQFEKDEVGDGYTRIGNQICYAWPLAAGENIALVTSPRENIIFVIANATAPGNSTIPLAGNTTLADFLKNQNGSLLTSLDDLSGSGIWYSPDGTDTNRYLRMSATKKVNSVTLGTTLGTAGEPLYLKRNCAKVIINVKNSSTDQDKVNIDAVQLRDINRQYHYVTNIPNGLPVSFIDEYSSLNPRRFSDVEHAFPVAYNTSGDTQTYTFYVPANKRGENTSIAAQGNKTRYAPQGATFFSVYATYGSPAKNITYSYYLGANLTTDFNLEPNKKYEFTININGKGNPVADSRIEDRNEVVFGMDANSYMLKPPSRAGASTIFSIPVRRAAVFWNQPGTNMGVYGAADREAYLLLESTQWEASVVWNEVKDANGDPVPDGDLLVGSTGTGFNPANPSATPYFKIKVQSGMKGNALVAIKKTSAPTQNDILWSWHLWVTDYDPYVQMTPVTDTYVYAVPGGEIHRYADAAGKTLWTSGDYKNAFIMDRNLGATVSIPLTNDTKPAIGPGYQWGRKDPFLNTSTAVSADNTGAPGEGTVKQNIRYSVHHPDTYISAEDNWTSYETSGALLGDNTVSPTWNDPKFTLHGVDNCEIGKSIYDPCPYGWHIPVNGTWSDFSLTTTEWFSEPNPCGRYYSPGGYDPLAPNGHIYYPATSTAGHCYSRTPNGMRGGLCLRYTAGSVLPSDNYYMGDRRRNALPVRCIRSSFTLPY